MKKIYLLAIGFIMVSTVKSIAQDTVMYEGFDYQSFYDNWIETSTPPDGSTTDVWFNYDADGYTDNTTALGPAWVASFPFSNVDTVDADLDGHNDNTVLLANSWFAPAGESDNWLITPAITLQANDTLFWKSAPYQTPRYLDGYKVLLSTTDNADFSFTTTLFTAAEMLGVNTGDGQDTVFSHFDFSPGFVHGEDGTYIDFADQSAMLHIGQLRPFSLSLSAYAGQTVFIAFRHQSYDDNLISLDDVMIRGNDIALGVKNEVKGDIKLNVFPNPSTDNAQVNYNLTEETAVTINIYDVTGKLVASESKGSQAAGRHFSVINTGAMANGFYTVSVQTNTGVTNTKMIVK
jgi:hypothetical protein